MPKRNGKKRGLPLMIYKNAMEVMAKANKAYHQLLEENKKLGIPTPFSLRGNVYHLMPDGRIILKK